MISDVVKFTFSLSKNLDNVVKRFIVEYEMVEGIKLPRQQALIKLIKDGLKYNCFGDRIEDEIDDD